jgi:hypothetical protein
MVEMGVDHICTRAIRLLCSNRIRFWDMLCLRPEAYSDRFGAYRPPVYGRNPYSSQCSMFRAPEVLGPGEVAPVDPVC